MSNARYELINVLGTPYNGGNLSFTTDGAWIGMAAGNRLKLVELMSGNSVIVKAESSSNIQHILIDPRESRYTILIDEAGRGLVLNLCTVPQARIGTFKFRDVVQCAAFSPCGNYIAIGLARNLEIHQVPSPETMWQPILKTRVGVDSVSLESIMWTACGKWVLCGGRDGIMRLVPACQELIRSLSKDAIDQDKYVTSKYIQIFTGQGQRIRGVFASIDGLTVRSIGSSGRICSYQWTPIDMDDEDNYYDTGYPNYFKGTWKEHQQFFASESEGQVTGAFQVPFRGTSAKLSKKRRHQMWVVGRSNGTCTAYDSLPTDALVPEPTLDALFNLTVGDDAIDEVSISPDGDWISIASKASGEIVVWEWRSETFVYKQSAHLGPIRAAAYSPSPTDVFASRKNENARADLRSNSRMSLGIAARSLAATGDDHGVLKIWDVDLGQCLHTIKDHTGAITDIVFTPQGNAFFTSSLDGSVRGYDLGRLRNFRVLVDPDFTSQFTNLTIDQSGEIIVASTEGGGAGDALIVWDIKTGKMLDRLNGHEGQISAVAYDPDAGEGGQIATSSFDKTVRVWDLYGRAGKGDKATILSHTSEVMALCYDPRSNGLLATSSLGGLIEIWDIKTGESVGSIQGHRDIYTGRESGAECASYKGSGGKDKKGGSSPNDAFYSSITYSPDGLMLACASKGSSRICFYSTITNSLIYGLYLTKNQSLTGVFRELRQHTLTLHETHRDELDVSSDEDIEDEEWKKQHKQYRNALPGVEGGTKSFQRQSKKLKIFQLSLSSDARSIIVATSHGAFVLGSYNAQSAIFANPITRQSSLLSFGFFGSHLKMDPDASVDGIYKLLRKGKFLKALQWSLQLGEMTALGTVYLSIEENNIVSVVSALNLAENMAVLNYIRLLLLPNGRNLVSNTNKDSIVTNGGKEIILGSTNPCPFIHLHLNWLSAIMTTNLGSLLINNDADRTGNGTASNQCPDYRTLLLLLLKSTQGCHGYLSKLYMPNLHEMKYIIDKNRIVNL